jgi:DNA-binding SARP family transcriptional activator
VLQECGIVYVTFLDDFSMTYNGKILDVSGIKSDKITELLAYIISHRYNNISVGELSDAMWSDEESDNPANALKNLVYRTRGILKLCFGATDFIKTGRGYYSWNRDVAVKTDSEEFERLYEKAGAESRYERRIEYQKRAVAYYKKHFLEQYTDCYWVVTLNAYYHSIYINVVVKLSKELYEQNDYKTMEMICNQALMLDELSEDVHYYYMRALISQNRGGEAGKHFEKLKELFNERLCVAPSKKLCSLNDNITMQGSSVLHRHSSGAVLCDYDMFKKSCELEKRRLRRSCGSAYIVKFTGGIAKHFLSTLTHSLRESDIVSVYDKAHYIILLSDCSRDNAKKIAERIIDNCKKTKQKNIPEYQLQKLDCDSNELKD